jgi:large subunit ribosomal protein L23
MELYKVEVSSVNVLHTREKFKYGKKRWMQLRKRSTKKAYVTLKDTKAKIDFSIIK